MSNVMELRRETEAARELLKSVADILGDDAELIASTVEGETGLKEALIKAAERVAELDALDESINATKERMTARQHRLATQRETLITAICEAMIMTGMPRLDTAAGLLSLKKVPPKLIVIADEDVPSQYWDVPEPPAPKINKKRLFDDIKAGKEVPGATKSNGGMTVQFKKS
jgi:hypothetical protein